MERLTMTSDKGGVALTFDLDVTCEKSEILKILKLAERLKYFEDLEEQGLLLKLPCKLGDTNYYIKEMGGLSIIDNCTAFSFDIRALQRFVVDSEGQRFNFSNFGKTVFLTEAEAEEALKRMERDENETD